MDDDDNNELDGSSLPEALFAQAMVYLLKDDEGIIVHNNEKGYIIWSNSEEMTISIAQDDEYLKQPQGQLIWMHYDGSKAPEPDFDEPIAGESRTLN